MSVHAAPRYVVAAALTLAGLSASIFAASANGATTSRSTSRVVITSAKNAQFGTILASGRTVYTLTASSVACRTTCLKYWPEVLLPKGVAKATAGPGVNAAKLGTIRRPNGSRQVTYGGRALYWYFKDTAPGQAKGNLTDTWGKWSVVILKPLAPGVTTTTSAGGGGGGIGF
ncbi:MAG: hypothetical protein KGJ36_01130 [Acidobacteriota bacterium]|nr:hypothetical protein [Acidobacteriota bacterium]